MKDALTPKKDKEEAIFAAALMVIKEKGFHKARMSDIAAKAGISYGLVYHYFRNKEDLFDAILNQWWEGLFRLMRQINVPGGDATKKLRNIINYFLTSYQKNPELVNVFITEISRSTSNLNQSRLKNFQEFMALTEAVISEAQTVAVLRSDIKARYLTYIFLGALETFVSAMVLVDQRIKSNAQKRRIEQGILEVFLNGARFQSESLAPR